jgi:hypothetical protein
VLFSESALKEFTVGDDSQVDVERTLFKTAATSNRQPKSQNDRENKLLMIYVLYHFGYF